MCEDFRPRLAIFGVVGRCTVAFSRLWSDHVTVRLHAARFHVAKGLHLLAPCAFLLCTLWARTAPAAPQHGAGGAETPPILIAFEWERAAGAEDCADGASLRRAAESLLDRSIIVPSDRANIFIRGRIEPTSNRRGYRAQLLLVASDGTVIGRRELQGDTADCGTLNESLALVIALAVDSLRATPAAVLRLPKAPPRTAARWAAEVGILGSAALGLMPKVSPAVGLEARLEPPAFVPFEVAFLAWPFKNVQYTPDGRGADFRAFAFRAFVCPTLFSPGAIQLRGCLGAEALLLTATGVAIDISHSPSSLIVGPTARAVFFSPLWGPSAFHLGAGLMLPLVRDRFFYRDEAGDERVIHRPSVTLPFAEIGISLRIP
jgi:hypothetical protein